MLGLEPRRLASSRIVSIFAAVLFVAGCEEEPVVPDDTPPDLSGSYTIVSFTSGFAPGDTLTPPAVSGSFTLEQTSVTGQEATGTLDLMVTIPDEATIENEGVYRNRFDGTWEQEFSTGFQALGTYTLQGNILTVLVTEPALAVSTTVWRRQ